MTDIPPAALDWQRPSHIGPHDPCMEVAFEENGFEDGDAVWIRWSDDYPALKFTMPEWQAFKQGVLAGEFQV